MSEKDLVNEIWAHRDDPEEWSEESEDIEVRPSRSSVVSFRLPREELAEIEQARAESGETLSEYIRGALALRLHGETVGSPAGIMYGSTGIPHAGSETLYEIPYEVSDQLLVKSTILMGALTKAYSRKASLLEGYGSWQPLQQKFALR